MTLEKIERPFGLWDSPISPRSLAADKRLDAPAWDADATLVWLESRSGVGVLVAQSPGSDAPRDLTAGLCVRAEVGYGGGDFTVHGGHVYFLVHKTGRIFQQRLSGGTARPITPAFGKAASPVVSPDGRWLAYLHQDEDQRDRIAVVDTDGRFWPQILVSGDDFYMQPRWSPDGQALCWIRWNHPQMPWDGAELCLAPVLQQAGSLPRLGPAEAIAGGRDVAVFQPEFTEDGGRLLYVSDETGWGRIAVHDLQSGLRRWLTPEGIEFSLPAWVHGLRTFALLPGDGSIIAVQNERGFQKLVKIDLESGETVDVRGTETYGDIAGVTADASGKRIAFVGSGSMVPPRIVVHDLKSGAATIAARASGETIAAKDLSLCKPIEWQTSDREIAHGLYYPPASGQFFSAGQPPLIVSIHGGPTSQVRAGWRSEAQFFATRGYAMLLVNYRGSTGYGREYMLKLRGDWGICDMEDAISGASHLAALGRIDPRKTVIMGGSAGGFTVLQTMVRRPDAFAAGISLYGVANQFDLAADTHKFESRYLDSLLGPLPEAAEIYRERSPALHADAIRKPMAIFQGDIDQVVPRAQSDMIVDSLRRNGTPHIYHVYEGEGHGWRKAETIEHFYAAVDKFLRRHLLFA